MYATSVPQYDTGLRTYLLSVFNNMSLALVISAVISAYVGLSPDLAMAIWGTGFKWVAIFSPLAVVFAVSYFIDRMTAATARTCLYIFAGLMGLSMSSIFLLYKLGSIIHIFFIAAATFGGTALYGYTTKKDLSSMGSFLMMGLIGLIICGVVNIFLQSSVFAFVISLVGLGIFIGLTAWDMQMIKETYYSMEGEEREKAGVLGALNLYMDFINVFMNLLQLLGDRKN